MTLPLLPLALGFGSAVTLAGANTFVKASNDIVGARAVTSMSGALIMLPFAFFTPLPNLATWEVLAFALPAHWLYQAALVRALSRGDLSLVFPVMRGSAPLLTALAAGLVLHEHLSILALSGLAIASLATITFAIPQKSAAQAKNVHRSAMVWAAATGVAIAMYNVIDARGTRVAPDPFSFTVWLFLLDWIGINTVTAITRKRRYVGMLRANIGYGFGAGALSVLSFSAALYGFSIAPVAYISALRETAVIFGALLGWFLLKEGFGVRRTAAALVLALGLSLLQFG